MAAEARAASPGAGPRETGNVWLLCFTANPRNKRWTGHPHPPFFDKTTIVVMLQGEPSEPNAADPSDSAPNDPSRFVGDGYGRSRSPAKASAPNVLDARCPQKLTGSPSVSPSASKDNIRPPKGKGELPSPPRGRHWADSGAPRPSSTPTENSCSGPRACSHSPHTVHRKPGANDARKPSV